MINLYTSWHTHSLHKVHPLTEDDLSDYTPYVLKQANAFREELIHGAEIKQVLNFKPFYVDLRQIDSTVNEEIHFRAEKGLVTLGIVIQGQIDLYDAHGNLLERLKKKQLCMSQAQPGIFKLACNAKHCVLLFITFLLDWLEDICLDFPNIMELIRQFNKGTIPYTGLPVCALDNFLANCLNMLYQLNLQNKGVMDGEIRICFSLFLQHYEERIGQVKGQLAYLVKEWLNEGYKRDDLGLELLADHFCCTGDTLRKNFNQTFHCTPHAYYTHLRMQHAHYLLSTEKQSVIQVYPQVGYHDERSFRYEYERYLKNPNKIRLL